MQGNLTVLQERNIGSLFLTMAIPAILIGLIVGLYNLVDAIIVGQFIGPEGVAAVSLSYVLSLFNWALAFFMGVGSMSLLSRALGAGDTKLANKIPGNLLAFNIICSLILTAITFTFSSQLLGIVGGSGEVLVQAEKYIQVLCLGYVAASNSIGLNFLLRGEGRMKAALMIVFASNGLNIALDYLLMGPLGMGIKGAALATIISQTAFLLTMIGYFASGRTTAKIKGVRLSRPLMPLVARVGVPAMLLMVLMALQQGVLLALTEHLQSAEMLIVMSAAMRLFTFLPILAKGVSEGMQPAIGVAWGARDYARIGKVLRGFTAYGTALILIPYALVMAFPAQILGLFITDSAIVSAGYPLLRTMFSAYLLYVVVFNISYYYIAIGKGKESLSFVLLRQVVLFAAAAAILPALMGPDGIWYAIPAADTLSIAIGLPLAGRTTAYGMMRMLGKRGTPDEAPAPTA